ncbi:hypothetical protein P7K49_024295 [Saguinus oedipus]|uniref:Uncharacterized protein n=1 Tax=Saguinus oedipus TaxID=9490 RepID=A0ABQ9UPX6_SAGOE|nr:hypothetical protein P7K49_024295 [Saguinus oedipus]
MVRVYKHVEGARGGEATTRGRLSGPQRLEAGWAGRGGSPASPQTVFIVLEPATFPAPHPVGPAFQDPAPSPAPPPPPAPPLAAAPSSRSWCCGAGEPRVSRAETRGCGPGTGHHGGAAWRTVFPGSGSRLGLVLELQQ